MFNLGVQELAILGCCGTVLIGATGALAAWFLFAGKDRKDE
jgi:hypothetical protein